MSKRVLGALGRGIHEMGGNIAKRNAAAADREFKQRIAAVQHKRKIALENLRHKHGMAGREFTAEQNMKGRQFSADEAMRGREFTAEQSNKRADRTIAAADRRTAMTVGAANARHASGNAAAMERLKYTNENRPGKTVTGADGVAYNVQGGQATPIMTPGQPEQGIIPPQPGEEAPMVPGQPQPFRPQPKAASASSKPAQQRLVEWLQSQGMTFDQALQQATASKTNPAQIRRWATDHVMDLQEQGFIDIPLGDQAALQEEIERVVAEWSGSGVPTGVRPPAPSPSAPPVKRYVPGKGIVSQ